MRVNGGKAYATSNRHHEVVGCKAADANVELRVSLFVNQHIVVGRATERAPEDFNWPGMLVP